LGRRGDRWRNLALRASWQPSRAAKAARLPEGFLSRLDMFWTFCCRVWLQPLAGRLLDHRVRPGLGRVAHPVGKEIRFGLAARVVVQLRRRRGVRRSWQPAKGIRRVVGADAAAISGGFDVAFEHWVVGVGFVNSVGPDLRANRASAGRTSKTRLWLWVRKSAVRVRPICSEIALTHPTGEMRKSCWAASPTQGVGARNRVFGTDTGPRY